MSRPDSRRAIRRHHYHRLKKNRKYYWGHDETDYPMDEETQAFIANTAKTCQHAMCSNQRKYYGKTVQELRDEEGCKEEVDELIESSNENPSGSLSTHITTCEW